MKKKAIKFEIRNIPHKVLEASLPAGYEFWVQTMIHCGN